MINEYDDILLRALREELRLVNKYLPYKRISLCRLIEMENPYIVSRDGAISLIDKRELMFLKNILGDKACELKIPIVIEYSPSMGEAAYIVRDETAARALSKILGIRYSGGELVIYRPQLYEIRVKLRTTTTIVFIPK